WLVAYADLRGRQRDRYVDDRQWTAEQLRSRDLRGSQRQSVGGNGQRPSAAVAENIDRVHRPGRGTRGRERIGRQRLGGHDHRPRQVQGWTTGAVWPPWRTAQPIRDGSASGSPWRAVDRDRPGRHAIQGRALRSGQLPDHAP